jgi:regulatory protein
MPVITGITEQKRRANRRNIYLDGTFAFGVNENVVARFRLRVGMSLTTDQTASIERGEVRQECFDKAMGYLGRRMHSRAELAKKLSKYEYGQTIIGSVLDQLQELKYVDDLRFAESRARSAAEHKHHGRRRAMMELRKAGVKSEVADRALENVYESHNSLAVARELARKKIKSLKRLDPMVARRRLVGMLQRRGFDYEDIKPVLDDVL